MSKELEELNNRIAELKPAHDEYCKLRGQVMTIERDNYEKQIKNNLNKLIFRTEFREPEWPDVGVPSESGFAYFKTEEDATELVKALNIKSSYGKHYMMDKWYGSGGYRCVPTHRYDHDGDLCYTGTFEKVNQDE